jgi:ABC-2 type transport system permease protein
MSAIVNQINVNAIEKINQQNFSKNNLITKAYFFNPLSFFQNKWNALTETDYHSYSDYRNYTQSKIDKRLELLVYDCWNSKKLDLKSYNEYLNLLK